MYLHDHDLLTTEGSLVDKSDVQIRKHSYVLYLEDTDKQPLLSFMYEHSAMTSVNCKAVMEEALNCCKVVFYTVLLVHLLK